MASRIDRIALGTAIAWGLCFGAIPWQSQGLTRSSLVRAAETAAAAAAPTREQRTLVREAQTAMRKAGNLYNAKRFKEAGTAAGEAAESLAKLPNDPPRQLATQVTSLRGQLERARKMLAAQGVTVPDVPPAPTPAPSEPSFVSQVAPILLGKCGGCHVRQARGQLSLASYAALAKGSPAGPIVMPGDADGSRLIEVLKSGDMPRGGGKLSAGELATLTAWIDAGAKFDGSDKAASLASLAPATPNAQPVAMKAAGEDDPVQFARDIGPVLVESCIECHGERNPRSGFSVSTFERLLRGGDRGAALEPGKPAESLLVKKLLGTADGARMPQGRPPLAQDVVAKFETWIRLGARFDGDDPALPLEETIARVAAGKMTHEQLTQKRIEQAEKTWRLILPDVEPNREESETVLVMGGVPREQLAEVARTAEEQAARLRKLFGVPDGEPLIKGRLTLYVFDKRFEYGEVGVMLERREIPQAWQGHWRYGPIDTYGCVLLGEDGQASAGLVAQLLAGVYAASLGPVPRWFAEGSARAAAARLDPRDPRVHAWDDQVGPILERIDDPAAFLAESLPPEDRDVLAYSFASKLLLSSGRKYTALVSQLQQGEDFETAFAKVYRAPPEALVEAWLSRVGKRR